MIRFPAAILLALAATPALAQEEHCNDYWFARNQLFDRAGYCFASPLGMAIFDNTGCIGKDVTLERGGDAFVAFIREMEDELGCAVDTNATTLDVPNIAMRLRLEVVVTLSEFASGCLGWNGDQIALRAGPRVGAEVLSVARPGDDLVWEFEAAAWPDGWQFLAAYRGMEQVALGWTDATIDEDLCTTVAG